MVFVKNDDAVGCREIRAGIGAPVTVPCNTEDFQNTVPAFRLKVTEDLGAEGEGSECAEGIKISRLYRPAAISKL